MKALIDRWHARRAVRNTKHWSVDCRLCRWLSK